MLRPEDWWSSRSTVIGLNWRDKGQEALCAKAFWNFPHLKRSRWFSTQGCHSGKLKTAPSRTARPCSRAANSSVGTHSGKCGLTPRSSGAPTACRQPWSVVRSIFHSPGLAAYCRRPLSSNVRHRQNRPPVCSRLRSSPRPPFEDHSHPDRHFDSCASESVLVLQAISAVLGPSAASNYAAQSGVLGRQCQRINSFDTNARNPCLQLGPPRLETPLQEDKLFPRQVGFLHVVVGYLPVATPAALPVVNTAVPNPSFKPSPNGVPRGPGWRYAVHFRHPGPRVTPSVPA